MERLDSASSLGLELELSRESPKDPSSSSSTETNAYLLGERFREKEPRPKKFTLAGFAKNNWGTAIFIVVATTLCLCGEFIGDWNLSWKAWVSLVVVFMAFVLMAKSLMRPQWVMLFGMTLLLFIIPKNSVIDLKGALSGFSQESVVTVAALYPVAEAITQTGGLDFVMKYALGVPSGVHSMIRSFIRVTLLRVLLFTRTFLSLLSSFGDSHPSETFSHFSRSSALFTDRSKRDYSQSQLFFALLRLMLPCVALSAFINNTPEVAIMIPVVKDWAKRCRIPASKLLIPLSYATILGGTCSMIGTSTNLTVLGLMQQRDPSFDPNIFEIALVGIPLSLMGVMYIITAAPWLLPVRQTATGNFASHVREYTISARVAPGSSVGGKTIAESELRHLTGLFLFEITRGADVFEAPPRDFRLQDNDTLHFSGDILAVRELWQHKGLVPSEQVGKVSGKGKRYLVEAVVATQSMFVGRTPKQVKFRTTFNAAIIAVHRGGHIVKGKIGEITLQGGDTLLLACTPSFIQINQNNHHFALVSEVSDSVREEIPKWKTLFSLFILFAMVVLVSCNVLKMFVAAMAACFLLIFARCVTFDQAWKSVDMGVIITIAASFAMGYALDKTGTAKAIAHSLIVICEKLGSVGLLFGLYLTTAMLSALLSNNATVALLAPVAYEFVLAGKLPLKAVAYTLMFAGSADFSTPIGYQTNLMVYSAGGYRFTDFAIIGVPLQLVCMLASVLFIHSVWV